MTAASVSARVDNLSETIAQQFAVAIAHSEPIIKSKRITFDKGVCGAAARDVRHLGDVMSIGRRKELAP